MLSSLRFFKDIGSISGDIAPRVGQTHGMPYIAVPIGEKFHLYTAEKLKLFKSSQSHGKKVTSIDCDDTYVYTATDSVLRQTDIDSEDYEEVSIDGPIRSMLSIGSKLLAARGKTITIYSAEDLSVAGELSFKSPVTCMIHPLTYTNKIIIAFEDGKMELWNLRSSMCIYSYKGFAAPASSMCQSTIPDVIAFALTDSTIVFHNIKTDKTMFELHHSASIAAMSFRKDGPAHFAVSLHDGSLVLWDLRLRQLLTIIQPCHEDGALLCEWLQNANALLTAGADNCIKQWIYDPDAKELLRVKRSRVGHRTPPSNVAFTEVNNTNYLFSTSGTYTVIRTNPFNETASIVLTTHPLKREQLKSPISTMATTNFSKYASVATIAEGTSLVYLWDGENGRFAGRTITAQKKQGAKMDGKEYITFADMYGEPHATTTFLSRCGNYGLVGSTSGTVTVFAIQSGRYVGCIQRQHDTTVVAVHVDPVNEQITSMGADGSVYFHSFNGLEYNGACSTPTSIIAAAFHPTGKLIAAICEGCICIIDCITKRIIRSFDADSSLGSFSHDGRLLYAAGRSRIYLFDIASGTLIEEAEPFAPVRGISVHPTGDMLATIHEGKIGVYLWRIETASPSLASMQSAEPTETIRFSTVPLSKFNAIVNPTKDPVRYPKAKKELPFFLSAVAGSSTTAADTDATTDLAPSIRPLSVFAERLRRDPASCFSYMMDLNPKDLDLEISALDKTDECDERILFLNVLHEELRSKRNYDMVQAILSVFLKEHGINLSEDPDGAAALSAFLETQTEAIQFLDDGAAHTLSLIQLLGRIQ